MENFENGGFRHTAKDGVRYAAGVWQAGVFGNRSLSMERILVEVGFSECTTG